MERTTVCAVCGVDSGRKLGNYSRRDGKKQRRITVSWVCSLACVLRVIADDAAKH